MFGLVWFRRVLTVWIGGYQHILDRIDILVLLRIPFFLAIGEMEVRLRHSLTNANGQSTYLEGLVCPRAQAHFLSSYTLVVIGVGWLFSTCTSLDVQIEDGYSLHGTFCESVSFRFSVYRM